MGKQAVFLDRDGTIIEDLGYLSDSRLLKLLPGAAHAIKLLSQNGLRVVVVSNQSGVARGLLTEQELERIHQELKAKLAGEGASIDAVYYCPHHSEIGNQVYRRDCSCRKPQPGMLKQAAVDLGLDLLRSYMIGDKRSDIEVGKSAGCKTVLVLTGEGRIEVSTE